MMLKSILQEQWHSLSDAALEQALYARIDFIRFYDLSLSDAIPDETIPYRFRNRLVAGARLDDRLASINEQLQSHGLMIKDAVGAVIDTTLIESAARPNAYSGWNAPGYLGTAKVNAQVMLKSICTNLKKLPTKFSWTSHQGEYSVQMLHKEENTLLKEEKLHFLPK
ncbi:transposase [Nitrosomonas supralitoralis]|uniref:Transposase InsH N-terminal domain-containing protein n=1 Tax=Nitrosomonas supralitoralis TaxID=2116706 RepID=A0A2P7NT95_9PROT|nr:transposase [Nitrosomonas supralitoralis]PSJ16648.1 hypothetical protein C7H79_12430 [Nitrosomonas supralitoralis]